jgi:hypothetical protein
MIRLQGWGLISRCDQIKKHCYDSPGLGEIKMNGTNRRVAIFIVGYIILLALGIYIICGFRIMWNALVLEISLYPMQPVEVNIQDPFIMDRENEFHLSSVIPRYDVVITAIEQYHRDHGSYPEELNNLNPAYLAQAPGIYLRSGENLTYELKPLWENAPPFTFSISGHYPFPAFMHGWHLAYCPSTYPGCAPGGDRHIHVYRVNDRWVWIHGSAL